MSLHPDIERLIVLVAEVQVERALREQKEKAPEADRPPGPNEHIESTNTTTKRRGKRAVGTPNNAEGAR